MQSKRNNQAYINVPRLLQYKDNSSYTSPYQENPPQKRIELKKVTPASIHYSLKKV